MGKIRSVQTTLFVLAMLLAPAAQSIALAQDARAAELQKARAQKAASQKGAPAAFDQATLVILTPAGPVFAELRISVAKIPYRTWVGRFLAQQMDINKDGLLNEPELNLLTDNVRQLAGISGEVAAAIKSSDVSSPPKTDDDKGSSKATDQSPSKAAAEDSITTRAFADWLHSRLPRAFDLIAQPQPADDAVRLASMIDSDGNGVVTPEELQTTFRTLRFRDLDDDQTLSVSELVPFRDPRSQDSALTPDAANLPFFHVTDAATARIAAERIMRRYGANEVIPVSVLRNPADAASTTGSTESLTSPQLESLLLAPKYHLSIDVKLSDRANISDIDVAVTSGAQPWCQVTDDSFGQTSLKLDGLPIRVFARGGTANTRKITRGYLGQTFVMVDADRSQSLDESEYAGIQSALQQSGADGDFASVDLNKDKLITRDELFSYADRDQMATASRIEVSVKQDGKSLFSLIDVNQDRRLAVREIVSGQQVLTKYDLNGDGSFAESELGTEYTLTFGLGQPEIRRSGGISMMNSMQTSTDAVLPGREGLSGPEWFRRMDRNQDGDVGPREFLGTREHFQRIDADADGLISPTEAASLTVTTSSSAN